MVQIFKVWKTNRIHACLDFCKILCTIFPLMWSSRCWCKNFLILQVRYLLDDMIQKLCIVQSDQSDFQIHVKLTCSFCCLQLVFKCHLKAEVRFSIYRREKDYFIQTNLSGIALSEGCDRVWLKKSWVTSSVIVKAWSTIINWVYQRLYF